MVNEGTFRKQPCSCTSSERLAKRESEDGEKVGRFKVLKMVAEISRSYSAALEIEVLLMALYVVAEKPKLCHLKPFLSLLLPSR
jgi:hypothetical protein